MRALLCGGNHAEALRVYERLRALLRDELGTVPSPRLRELHERVLDALEPSEPLLSAVTAQ
jgi:DNA-binding SARP family transcriptional activator